MAKYRKNKINAAFTEECAQILRDIKDPRVSGEMITVMSSDVSADLKFAKVYYSVYGECDDKELRKGLKSATPFIRSRGKEVSHSLNYQKLGKDLASVDELSVLDGGKCILQLRGVRPFLSDKYDITKHPNYKYLSD